MSCYKASIDPAMSWDPLGGAPDAFCQLEMPTGTITGYTDTAYDSYFPEWNQYVHTGTLKAGDLMGGVPWTLWVLDEDADANDSICGAKGPMQAGSFEAGGFTMTNAGGCLSWTVNLMCAD